MTPHPTPEPPQGKTQIPDGFEEIPTSFLREHGAVEGMKWHAQEWPEGQWENYFHKTWPENLETLARDFGTFAAPLGTMAAALTPLPEPRCDCEPFATGGDFDHPRTCSIHLRYRHVLPGELAKMETKPEGLMYAQMGTSLWVPFGPVWKPRTETWNNGHSAYALPLQPDKGKGGEPVAFQGCMGTVAPNAEDVVTPPAPTGDEELRVRVRIAEFCGYRLTERKTHRGNPIFEKDGTLYAVSHATIDCCDFLPDYLHDLNAIASAEANLLGDGKSSDSQDLWLKFEAELLKQTGWQGGVGWSRTAAIHLSTAHQHALALLHTIEEKEQRE